MTQIGVQMQFFSWSIFFSARLSNILPRFKDTFLSVFEMTFENSDYFQFIDNIKSNFAGN
ncbi:MAG: hypothetical protein RL632_916 [Bacteroidota bacterium]|jgi:hypothetical protein